MALDAVTQRLERIAQALANRDQDRVHLRDMIEVGLVDRKMIGELPLELAGRLDSLLVEAGS